MATQVHRSDLVTSPRHDDPWRVMPAKILGVTAEGPEVRTYQIALTDSVDAERYRILPGQFNMIYLPGVGESAISVSGDPRHCHPLLHTIRAVGNVTGSLALRGVGASLGIRGPFGSSWPIQQCGGRDLILVAGGIGLAPLRSVIYDVIANRDFYRRVWLLMGARSPEHLLYANQYDHWRGNGIEVLTTVDHAGNDWKGNVGVVTPLLEALRLTDAQSTHLMTCGPEIMMRFAAQAAIRMGLRADQIWVTLERNMRCAFGHCGHCQFGPHFICKDGPVLSYDRVADLLGIDSL